MEDSEAAKNSGKSERRKGGLITMPFIIGYYIYQNLCIYVFMYINSYSLNNYTIMGFFYIKFSTLKAEFLIWFFINLFFQVKKKTLQEYDLGI